MDIKAALHKLIAENLEARQTLDRKPEPVAVTRNTARVEEYGRVLDTNMAATYAVALSFVYRARSDQSTSCALDVCCGPGLFAHFLATLLDYGHVEAIDLSPAMIESARALHHGLNGQLTFRLMDARNIGTYPPHSFDLVSLTNAAHHFEQLDQIRSVLVAAEQITKPDGLILVSDVARLKNARISEAFAELAGADYRQLNMHHLYEEFRNSMFAAWLPDELASAIPEESPRVWVQMVSKGLGFYQALLGLPVGREEVFVRPYNTDITKHVLKTESSKSVYTLFKSIREVVKVKA